MKAQHSIEAQGNQHEPQHITQQNGAFRGLRMRGDDGRNGAAQPMHADRGKRSAGDAGNGSFADRPRSSLMPRPPPSGSARSGRGGARCDSLRSLATCVPLIDCENPDDLVETGTRTKESRRNRTPGKGSEQPVDEIVSQEPARGHGCREDRDDGRQIFPFSRTQAVLASARSLTPFYH